MSDFVNTVDVIGDEELIDQIIQRTVTEFKDDTVTYVGNNAFRGCASLTEVSLLAVTKVGQGTFEGAGIQRLYLPEVTNTGTYAFSACVSLVEVSMPKITKIEESVFGGCSSLKSVNDQMFPMLNELAKNVFRGCRGLNDVRLSNVTIVATGSLGETGAKKVDLPKLETIKASAFLWSQSLSALILRGGTMCSLENVNAFSYTPIGDDTRGPGYIYVPRALVGTYKAATNWSTFASKFRALEDYTVDGTITGELDESKI